MTVKELRARAQELGIKVPARATKNQLERLVAQAAMVCMADATEWESETVEAGQEEPQKIATHTHDSRPTFTASNLYLARYAVAAIAATAIYSGRLARRWWDSREVYVPAFHPFQAA